MFPTKLWEQGSIQVEEEDQWLTGLHSLLELSLQEGQRVSHPINTEFTKLIS